MRAEEGGGFLSSVTIPTEELIADAAPLISMAEEVMGTAEAEETSPAHDDQSIHDLALANLHLVGM